MTTVYACSRCGGTGRLAHHSNVLGGVCFKCQGTGKQRTKPGAPTPKWAVFGQHRTSGQWMRLHNVGAKTKAMAIDRAKVLKGILWPAPEPLFHIIKQGAYFRPNYCGYTDSQVDAGKYTQAELKPYANGIKRGDLQAVPV